MSYDRDVTTTDGEVFTFEQACQMAELVYLRFGKNLNAASEAWSRMMQNDTSPAQFAGLIEDALKFKLDRALAPHGEWWRQRALHVASGSDDHDAVAGQ